MMCSAGAQCASSLIGCEEEQTHTAEKIPSH
jgi:hypothetical protein